MSLPKGLASARAMAACWPDGTGEAACLEVLEVHHACACSWTPAPGEQTRVVRKYADAACPAASWHRRREMAAAQ